MSGLMALALGLHFNFGSRLGDHTQINYVVTDAGDQITTDSGDFITI